MKILSNYLLGLASLLLPQFALAQGLRLNVDEASGQSLYAVDQLVDQGVLLKDLGEPNTYFVNQHRLRYISGNSKKISETPIELLRRAFGPKVKITEVDPYTAVLGTQDGEDY